MHTGQETLQRLNRTIAPGDGMLAGNEVHYFHVGSSAIKCIRDAMATARIEGDSPKKVLDYACGYGRVLRWLQAEFPDAELLGVDADPKAVAGAAAALGVRTRELDVSLQTPFEDSFELIWVGSLFTHLPADELARVLAYLSRCLAPQGLLVFTTHGRLVEDRLRTRDRLYGLSEDSAREVVQSVEKTGYGFAPYSGSKNYGISVARPWFVAKAVGDAGMQLVQFQDRAWASHQDVFAARLV